jgi:hypothetical protein
MFFIVSLSDRTCSSPVLVISIRISISHQYENQSTFDLIHRSGLEVVVPGLPGPHFTVEQKQIKENQIKTFKEEKIKQAFLTKPQIGNSTSSTLLQWKTT